MCWSFDVSVLTGSISYSIALYLWLRNYGNDRWHSIILLTFSSIQWTDATLWYFKDHNQLQSKIVTLVRTTFIPLILSLEPLAVLLGAYYMGKSISQIDMVIYGILSLFLFYSFSRSVPRTNWDLFRNSDGIQYSQSNNIPSYWIFFFLLVYPVLKYSHRDGFDMLMVIIVAISLWLAQKRLAIGSHWCLYSNILSLFFLFYPYLKV